MRCNAHQQANVRNDLNAFVLRHAEQSGSLRDYTANDATSN